MAGYWVKIVNLAHACAWTTKLNFINFAFIIIIILMKTDDTATPMQGFTLDIKVQTIKTRKTKFYKLWIVGNLQWRGWDAVRSAVLV